MKTRKIEKSRSAAHAGEFHGKTVVVTGAGCNLGRALARRFLLAGAKVVAADRDAAAVDDVRKEFSRIDKMRSRCVVCDVSSESSVAQLFTVAREAFGGVDVLVNNAAHQGVGYSFLNTPLELFDAVIAVNIRGVFLCAQAAARMMRDGGRGGAIVNISSNTSERAIRNRVAYIGSKGAIDAMTRAMAVDLAPSIRVNTVAPGFIWTPRWNAIGEEACARRKSCIPLGEPASFDDVAEVALFLAGDRARGVTGARYVVDGGCAAQHLPASLDG